MMCGEMPPGAFCTRYDHPIEEFHMGLSGEIIMDIEDQACRLGAGDVARTGVGTSHVFRHTGTAACRFSGRKRKRRNSRQSTTRVTTWSGRNCGRGGEIAIQSAVAPSSDQRRRGPE